MYKWKLFGTEFLGMDIMFDALFVTSKPSEETKSNKFDFRNEIDKEGKHKIIREPLASLVDYKGFRAIAYAFIPIQPTLGVELGFSKDQYQ